MLECAGAADILPSLKSGQVADLFRHNTIGDLKSVSADRRTSSFKYDERGNLTTATGPGGVVDGYANFVSGMPGTVSAANGTYNAGIARDGWGRTTSVASTGIGAGVGTLQTSFGYSGPWLNSVQPSGGLAGSAIVYSMVKDGGTAGYQAKSFYYKLTGRKVVTDGGEAGKRVHQEWWDSAGRAWRSGDGPATGTGNTLDAANAVYSTVLYDACGGVRIAFPPHRNGDVSVAASGYISPFNIYLGFSASFRDAFGRPAIIGDTSGLSTGANFSIGRSTTYSYLKDGNSALKVTAHNSASTSSFYASVYGTTTIDRLQGPSPAALVATQTQGPLTGGTVPPSPKTTTYSYNARAQLTATNTSAAGVSPLLDTTEYNALGDPVSSRSPESGESRVLARDSRFRPVTISVPCTDPVAIVLNTSVSVTAIADSLFVRAPSGTTSSPSPSVRAPSGATSPPPLNSRSLMHTFFPSSLTTTKACALTSAYDNADRLTSLTMSGGEDPSSYSFSYVSGADLPASESGYNASASYDLVYTYTSGSPLPESSTITYYVPGLPAISFSLAFTRNPFGELTELNINNAHTLTYTRDGLGRVTKVTRSAGATASTDLVKSILYQPNGSLMRLTTGNNILTDYYQLYGWGVPSCTSVYNLAVTAGPTRENAAQFYALIPGTVSGGTPSQRQFWTDQDLVWSGGKFQTDNHLNPLIQNVGPMVDGLHQTNTFDRESQLAGNSATSTPYKKGLTYAYDPLHNRTQQVQRTKVGSQWILTATTTYAYEAATNRLASATLVNSKYPAPGNTKYYYHDARGNLTATTVTASVLPSDTSGTFVTHSYAYDLLNHLVSADSNRVRFAYLANGMKYLKLTESTLYGSTIIPPLATLYFYGPSGELIYEATYNRSTGNRISDTYFFHAAGLLVGELTSGNLNTPAFVSRQYDTDVGLYYLNARWYDPTLGRFVSVDPIPSSLNQYAYAGNNPIRFEDANGTFFGPKKINMFQSRQEIMTEPPDFRYVDLSSLESALCTNCNLAERMAWSFNAARCTPGMPTFGPCANAKLMVYLEDNRGLPVTDSLDYWYLESSATPVPFDDWLAISMIGSLRFERGMGRAARVGEEAEEVLSAAARTKWGDVHGYKNKRHNNAIETLLDWAEKMGATSIRKHKAQVDVNGLRASSRLPDGSYVLDDVRYNANFVSNFQRNNVSELNREIRAFNDICTADPNAQTSLIFDY